MTQDVVAFSEVSRPCFCLTCEKPPEAQSSFEQLGLEFRPVPYSANRWNSGLWGTMAGHFARAVTPLPFRPNGTPANTLKHRETTCGKLQNSYASVRIRYPPPIPPLRIKGLPVLIFPSYMLNTGLDTSARREMLPNSATGNLEKC